MEDNPQDTRSIELAADIISAYVSNNNVGSGDLAGLIRDVHTALQQSASGGGQPEPEPQEPAVPIKKSVRPEHIVCLEDGKTFKSLKRHLRTDHNLSPEEYRSKWGLPRDYPMVAPNYAKQRSELAKALGLGQIRRGQAATEVPPAPEPEGAAEPTAKRRAPRKRKEAAVA